jgi:hypothetical protein
MVKVNFVDFWEEFDPTEDPIFGTFLRKRYGAKISEIPDVLFFSDLGSTHRDRRWKKCTKVFYTAENRGTPVQRTLIDRFSGVLRHTLGAGHYQSRTPSSTIDFNCCDFAISHHYIKDKRHLRLPNYVRRYGLERLQCLKKPKRASDILERKKAFCCFVYSNARSDLPGVALRNELFRMLCEYRKVDSAGSVLNNMDGYVVPRDLETYLKFISQYKFVITFESSEGRGYTTEKIFHAMLANTLPIYWGNPEVQRDFNEESFINFYKYDDLNAVVNRVIRTDESDKLYGHYMSQPCLTKGGYLERISERTLVRFFNRVFGIETQ